MRCRPLARLVLPTLVVLPLLFLLAAAPALAGPRTVDGDPSDWTGVASPVAHTDANPADAWIYTGVVGDRRTEPGMTDASDLVELRLTADATNLYVLARLADVAAGTVGDVHVALGFDATHSPLAGAAELASLGDDTGLTFAGRPFIRPETLVLLRTSNGATPVVDVFAGGAWTNPAGAQIAISQANDLVEASVPLAALGLTNTADVIVTAATFRNQPGAPAAADTTAAFADHDAIDSLGLPGQLGDADARDLDDGAIDRGWWLRFQGAVDAPTAIVWDGLYHSSCDQFRLTACASSDHPADENLPNDNNIPSGDPPTFQEAQRWGGGGTIPGRATDVYVYDDEPMVLSALALAGDVPDGATNPRILFFGSGATVDMTAQEDWTGSWHGAVERTYTIFQGAIPPQPPGDVFYSFQIEDGAGTRSLCRTNGGPATALERTAIGQWVSADGCAFADYAYSVLDDDTSGPTIENVQLLPPEGLGNSVCADIVDAITDSGDNDSGFGSALVRYSANKADVLAGAGTTAAFALQGGDTYCATTATFTDPTYYRVEAFNGDSDGPADNDASRSSVLCFGASCVLGAPGDNDIRWSEVLHDTRDLFYRAPFGAIEAETPLVLRLRTAQDDLSDAAVRVYATPLGDITLTMTQVVESDPTYDWWEVALPTDATAQPSQLFYKFLLFDGTASAWYIDDYSHNSYDHEDRFENGRGMVVEDGEAPAFFGNSFNITVYDPGFTTPAWSQGATIYQILPDRFRNGDPSNDSAWPYGDVYGTPIFLHSTWNEAPVNTRDPADPFFNQWSADFFGGDLQGVMDELDTLSELGVTAIYFNPIFSAPSNHGYDTTDYLRVSPRYGTNDDFAALADAAEARGIKIILDGVFNHSGSDSIYLDRASHWDVDGNPASGNDGSGACEGPGSPYAAFFNLFGTDGPCYDGLNYDSWFGFDTLPLLIDFVPGNIVRDFVFDFDGDGDNGLTAGPDATPGVIQHWYELGADGWRFDVADELPHDFWIAFREQVKNQDGWDGPLYSEVWYEAVPWVFGDQMDATMNYRFRKAVLGFLVDSDFVDNDSNGEQTIWQLPATDFDTVLTAIREDYPEVAWRTMMNLMGSHDTNRPLFVLGERSSDYAAAVAKMKMMAAIMFSYPGAPTVYFGDEVGIGAAAHGGPHLWGAGFVSDGILQDDPHNRHPFPWRPDAEDPYAQRVDDAFESVTGVLPATLPADDLRDHYATLGRLRRAVPVFAAGDVVTLLADDATEVYAYALVDDTLAPPCAVAVHNRSATTRTVSLTGLPAACSGLTFEDVLDGGTDHTAAGTSLTVTGVGSLTSAVLVPPFIDAAVRSDSEPAMLPVDQIDAVGDAVIEVLPGGGSTVLLTFEVRDIAGQLAPAGLMIDVALAGSGTLDASRITTDGSGRASVTYNLPALPGVVRPGAAHVRASIARTGRPTVETSALVVYNAGASIARADRALTGIGPEVVSLTGSAEGASAPLLVVKEGIGEPIVGLVGYATNPQLVAPQTSVASDYALVTLDDAINVDRVDLKIGYSDASGEADHRVLWWTGTGWRDVSQRAVDVANDLVPLVIDNASTPSLADLADGSGATFVVVRGPAGADLSLTLDVPDTSIPVNASTTFTITLTNDALSETTAENITVDVALPPEISFDGWTLTDGTLIGGVWTVPALAPGASTVLTIDGTVLETGMILYDVEVTAADNPDPDSTPGDGAGDDAAVLGLTGGQATNDLAFTVSTFANYAFRGEVITLTVTATNAGPSTVIDGFVVVDQPGQTTSFNWSCVGTGLATCTASGSGSFFDEVDIPVGGAVTYTIDVGIAIDATPAILFGGSVAPPVGSDDPDTDNNAADLALVASAPPFFDDGFESADTSVWTATVPTARLVTETFGAPRGDHETTIRLDAKSRRDLGATPTPLWLGANADGRTIAALEARRTADGDVAVRIGWSSADGWQVSAWAPLVVDANETVALDVVWRRAGADASDGALLIGRGDDALVVWHDALPDAGALGSVRQLR